MEKKPNLGRRDFLKKTAVGAAGLTAGMSLLKPAKAMGAWTNGMQINKNIDNLRVVTYYDESMFTNFATASKTIPSNLSGQEALLSGKVIQNNMDAMAIKLAQKADAATSWATIFSIPSTKTWATAQAAIKVNCVDTVNMPAYSYYWKNLHCADRPRHDGKKHHRLRFRRFSSGCRL